MATAKKSKSVTKKKVTRKASVSLIPSLSDMGMVKKKKVTKKSSVKKKSVTKSKVSKRKVGTSRVIVILRQHGTSNKKSDKRISALKPGKRMSKSGNIYWETRANRSDKNPTLRL